LVKGHGRITNNQCFKKLCSEPYIKMKTLLPFVLFVLFVAACTPSKVAAPSTATEVANGNTTPVLFSVNGRPVHTDEFLYVYNKNNYNRDSANTEKAVTDYLDLYKVFKLKVEEAYQLGLDQEPSFLNEFEGYRQQLVKPYLTEGAANEKLVRQVYERMKEEVKASHILIRVEEDVEAEDGGDEADVVPAFG